MITPTATILIAAYNRLPMLRRALASAVQQRFDSFEVLVIDDGSGDVTRSWLHEQALVNQRLRIKHQSHQGPAVARRNGVTESRGTWVCILDSDDELVPDALRTILAVFDRDPATDLVYSNYVSVRPDGGTRLVKLPTYSTNADMIRATLLRPKVPFKHSGTTFRRQTALELGSYDATLPMKIDVEFFLRFLSAGRRLTLLEEPVVRFLFHPDSVSRRRREGIEVWYQLIDRYGPSSSTTRFWYKRIRSFAERLKRYYEVVSVGSGSAQGRMR